jgi:3',5'-cyclic AMP phosphodiesterase CpdA
VAEIRGLGSKPAAAIVAGDCAFLKGEPGDYTLFGELLNPLREAGTAVHLALGNHDQRERLLAAFPEARSQAVPAELPQKCVSLVETPHADWLLLDSLDKTNHSLGLLGQAQMAWLAKALDARPDKPALVLMHLNPDRLLNIHGLTDTKALFEALMPRRRVKALFYGHTHCWHVGRQAGVHLVNLPAVAWLFDQTEPRGFVTLQVRGDGATLVLHALDHKHPKHGETAELKWRT